MASLHTNPDTSYQGPEDAPDSEHSYSNHVAQTQGTYYDVPLTGSLVDTDQNPERLNALEALPFFLMVSRGGMHVTAGVDGEINELARNEGPDSDVIYQDPLRDIDNVYSDLYGGEKKVTRRSATLGIWLDLLPGCTATWDGIYSKGPCEIPLRFSQLELSWLVWLMGSALLVGTVRSHHGCVIQ